MIFQAAGCQMVGFGTIDDYEYGVNIASGAGSRVEMVFTHIQSEAFTGADSTTIDFQGSFGTAWNSHVEPGDANGVVARWDAAHGRWEPTGVTISEDGQTLTGPIVIGAVYQ